MAAQAAPPHRISFPVANVTPATDPLPVRSLRASLEETLRSKVIVCEDAALQVIETSDFHPLIASAALAFKHHHSLVLCPDIIWITILQGVAQHIRNHASELRHRLVQHETKIELVVDSELGGLPATDAEMLGLVSAFLDRMIRHLPPDKRFLLGVEFSTTTDAARIASCVTFMDAMQPYFDYIFAIICGIPSVVLEGMTGDWELLHSKVQALHESDLNLSWWTKHLLPLIDHFVRASRGDVDTGHWRNLCKVIERYGVDDLNGWLLKFVPYVKREKNESPIHRNPVLELTEYPDSAESRFEITGCTSNMLPSGLSRVPVTCLNSKTGSSEQFEFTSGFIGVIQDKDHLSLKAHIGWAISAGCRIDRLIRRLRSEHVAHPSAMHSPQNLTERFGGYLPADLWRFYSETDGCQITNSKTKVQYELLGIEKIGRVWDPSETELKRLYHDRQWSVFDYSEQRGFAHSYGRLIRIATCDNGTFVFGSDPEQFHIGGTNESRGSVFFWTGEFAAGAFTPVAHTFSDWLEQLLTEK